MATAYPIELEVDPAAPQGRASIFFRLLLVIPHLLIVSILLMANFFVWFLSWFVILFTGRYPEGMWRFSAGCFRWLNRATGYFMLLTDKYPPFSLEEDPAYPIRMPVSERIEGRNRLTTFWPLRFIMAIPHLLIIYVLQLLITYVLIWIAWIIALIIGRLPGGLHNFFAGTQRWNARVTGYVYNLCDEYPPFSM